MRTIAYFSKTLPSKIADEVRAAGYTVLRPLEVAEVMHLCERHGVGRGNNRAGRTGG